MATTFGDIDLAADLAYQSKVYFTGDNQYTQPAFATVSAAWAATMARLEVPEVLAEIIADEELLFDRSKNRVFFVDEYQSDLAGGGI